MPYIGTQPKDVRSFGKAQFDFTATQGQTAFTGADDDGKTLGFTEGQIQVYVNGILMDASDYTTSNANTVTLVSAANLNDIITVVALQTDIPNSDYVPISGGTFTGNVSGTTADFSGDVGIGTNSPDTDLHISSSSVDPVKVESSHSSGSYITLRDDTTSASPDHVWIGAKGNKTRFFQSNTLLSMEIDSAGRVTMPSQPYVTVGGQINSANGYTSTTGKQPLNLVLQGNAEGTAAYNTSTYRFTAPVTGLYQVSFHTLWSSSTNNEIGFKVNGTLKGRFFTHADRTIHGTAHYKAAQGDYFELHSSQGLYMNDYSNAYTSVTYRLVG